MKEILFNQDKIISKFSEGIESDLYLYENDTKIQLLKIFKKEIKLNGKNLGIPSYKVCDDKIIITEDVLNNKEKKIKLLSNIDELRDEVTLLNCVYDKEGLFIGYTMEVESKKTLNDITSRKEKIKYLRQIKEKVIRLNENNIYIGDFNNNNFIIENDKVKLCDLDNFKIDDLDFDLLSHHQLMFRKNRGRESLIDNYCYNMLTISVLGRVYQPYTVQYIQNEGLPYPINTRENRKYIKDLTKINYNYRENYLIDDLQYPYCKIKNKTTL